MTRLRSLLFATVLFAAGASAAAPHSPDPKGEAQLAQLVAGRVAGKPVSCINAHDYDNVEIIDHTALVYRDGSRLYVNRPTGGREFLDNDDVLVTRLYSSQLCRVDPVNLVDRYTRFPSGFVSLGDFVPYTKPQAAGR